ncbi:uncharacterized protein LOC135163962 [Diachasmimorpha longicaudata]|uniref:uncharacterized protein LOC135163962 n=1 Tax=Diachasmimorpha longicaudata TaxID=58733 RepID=UPI0030B9079C
MQKVTIKMPNDGDVCSRRLLKQHRDCCTSFWETNPNQPTIPLLYRNVYIAGLPPFTMVQNNVSLVPLIDSQSTVMNTEIVVIKIHTREVISDSRHLKKNVILVMYTSLRKKNVDLRHVEDPLVLDGVTSLRNISSIPTRIKIYTRVSALFASDLRIKKFFTSAGLEECPMVLPGQHISTFLDRQITTWKNQ